MMRDGWSSSPLTALVPQDITANYTAEPRFAVQVDLPAMVSALPTSGVTEYSFHSQIGLGFRKAWDTHTQYTLPSCFTDWTYCESLPPMHSSCHVASACSRPFQDLRLRREWRPGYEGVCRRVCRQCERTGARQQCTKCHSIYCVR